MILSSPRTSALQSFLGVLLVSLCWGLGGPLSFSAVQKLSPAEAAFGRCLFAFFGLAPFWLRDGSRLLRGLSPRAFALLALNGLLLGVHFTFFISGVAYASLATAVTLVAVEPVLLLAVGVLAFRERLTRHSVLGIILCTLGILTLSVLPHLLAGKPLASGRGYGDLSAVLAVLTYAVYYGINRSLQPEEARLSLPGGALRKGFCMASVVYFFASLSAGLLILLAPDGSRAFRIGTPGPAIDGKTLVALIAMGLLPTLVGHTLSQILTRRAHPVWISLMSPGETLMSLLIGVLFLNQSLGIHEILGGLWIGAGVLVTLRGELLREASL